jgi:lysophospholipase L1-like esterase
VVPLLNAEIRTLATAEGVPLVDVFDAFNGDLSLLGADGLHPNAEGFARIASKFYDVIRERLEVTQTAAETGLHAPPLSAAPWGR